MSAGDGDPNDRGTPPEPLALPPLVRERVVALAADRLAALSADQVPAPLRRLRTFHPGKRARLAAVPLAAALETDAAFRQQVADGVRDRWPDLAEAVTAGGALPAAAPEDVAALAYLLRPPGWTSYVEVAASDLAAREDAAAGAASVDAVARLTEQLAAARVSARSDAARLGGLLEQARAEVAALRRAVREQDQRVARAEAGARSAQESLRAARGTLAGQQAAGEAELRRQRQRAEDAEAALASVRAAGREGRRGDDLRLRVLLDALLGAAQGLRRELALPPIHSRPADALAADYLPPVAPPTVSAQGRSEDDPTLLDALLAVPGTHLLVDGYNVTKGGYGELTLEAQRGRLVLGLAGLAARTGAEVTVVFDGVERATPLAPAAPRNVRVLFSRATETADDVLRRLAAHEPPGRPVVVVSSDREVADGVRRSGARPLASQALLRLLER